MFKLYTFFKPTFMQKNLAYLFQPYLVFFFLTVAILSIFSPSKTLAQGNLVITPRRIVFEGQKNIQEFTLANTGNDTARYLISIIELRMMKNGQFEKITQPDSGQNFASSHIRFYPQSVTLFPNKSKSVKVQIYKPNLLLPGEYRSHIYIRAEANEGELGQIKVKKDSSHFSVHIVPVFGLSIPVIIRKGESTTKVLISDINIEMINDSIPVLNMIFYRSGNMSVYGNLSINFISAKGTITEVAAINGIAVYTPTSSRQLKVKLAKKPGIDYHTGKLSIIYKMTPEDKSLKIAEGDLILH